MLINLFLFTLSFVILHLLFPASSYFFFLFFPLSLFPSYLSCVPLPLVKMSYSIYLLSLQTQRDGLIFIYDMTNSSYGNFDYELCVKILNLLKVKMKSQNSSFALPFNSLLVI